MKQQDALTLLHSVSRFRPSYKRRLMAKQCSQSMKKAGEELRAPLERTRSASEQTTDTSLFYDCCRPHTKRTSVVLAFAVAKH